MSFSETHLPETKDNRLVFDDSADPTAMDKENRTNCSPITGLYRAIMPAYALEKSISECKKKTESYIKDMIGYNHLAIGMRGGGLSHYINETFIQPRYNQFQDTLIFSPYEKMSGVWGSLIKAGCAEVNSSFIYELTDFEQEFRRLRLKAKQNPTENFLFIIHEGVGHKGFFKQYQKAYKMFTSTIVRNNDPNMAEVLDEVLEDVDGAFKELIEYMLFKNQKKDNITLIISNQYLCYPNTMKKVFAYFHTFQQHTNDQLKRCAQMFDQRVHDETDLKNTIKDLHRCAILINNMKPTNVGGNNIAMVSYRNVDIAGERSIDKVEDIYYDTMTLIENKLPSTLKINPDEKFKCVYSFGMAKMSSDGNLAVPVNPNIGSSYNVITDIVIMHRNGWKTPIGKYADTNFVSNADVHMPIEWEDECYNNNRYGVVDMKGKWINCSGGIIGGFGSHFPSDWVIYVHGFNTAEHYATELSRLNVLLNEFQIPMDHGLHPIKRNWKKFNSYIFQPDEEMVEVYAKKLELVKFTKAGLHAYHLINPCYFRFANFSYEKETSPLGEVRAYWTNKSPESGLGDVVVKRLIAERY